MYLLIFVIIFVNCCCDIKVLIDNKSDDYNIIVNNRIWLRSSYTGLYNNNQWYKTNDGSLILIDKLNRKGNDLILGDWNETKFIYNLNNNLNISGTIRQWKSIEAITFYFDNGLNILKNQILLDMDSVSTVFPSFFIEKIDQYDHRGYFTFGGKKIFFFIFFFKK